MKIAVIGAGSWGTALAMKAAEATQEAWVYCRRPEAAATMQADRENKSYLPGVSLPAGLTISADLEATLQGAAIVLMVTPSIYVRDTLRQLADYICDDMCVVVCSKGVERSTGKRMSEILSEEVGTRTKHLGILSGPNHAEEIGRGLPAATVIASKDAFTRERVQQGLSSASFRVYGNQDVTGVELAATTKNIVALAAGIADGMELGDNCKAMLLTRGLHEMTRLGIAYGADRATYAGLAGMGDLVATCMSKHSRNRAAGEQLAQGKTMKYIMESTNMVVEGFFAVQTIYECAKEKQIEMPITTALYEVLYLEKSPAAVLMSLMTRDSKDEMMLN